MAASSLTGTPLRIDCPVIGSTRRDLGALGACRALPASADCASPGAGVTFDHLLLLSRCCQGRIRASGPATRRRSQRLGFEGEAVEPTSGIEPLTCSLRDPEDPEE